MSDRETILATYATTFVVWSLLFCWLTGPWIGFPLAALLTFIGAIDDS